MQEYINELQQKVGLTAEQAKSAIETIVNKVKTKIPESLHGSIDSIFSGNAGNTLSSLQQKAGAYADQAGQKLKEFGAQAREQLSELSDQAEDLAQGVQGKAEQAAKEFGDKLSDMFGKKTPPEQQS